MGSKSTPFAAKELKDDVLTREGCYPPGQSCHLTSGQYHSANGFGHLDEHPTTLVVFLQAEIITIKLIRELLKSDIFRHMLQVCWTTHTYMHKCHIHQKSIHK